MPVGDELGKAVGAAGAELGILAGKIGATVTTGSVGVSVGETVSTLEGAEGGATVG